MRTNRGWFQACYSKGDGHHHLHLAGKGAGKLYSEKKWRLQGYSDWRLLAKRSGNSWLEEGHLCVIGLGSKFGFLWLVLSWKWGQRFKKLTTVDSVLIILGWLLQRLWFCFPSWLLQSLWVIIQLSNMVWQLSVYIFDPSVHTHIHDFHFHFQIETFIK